MSETKYTKDDLKTLGERWMERIRGAEKREKDWLTDAQAAQDAYLCNDTETAIPQFNILHSNVETIVPAIFNSNPVPEIRPRHGSREDPIAKVVADILERAIEVQIDDSRLDKEIEAEAQDAFMSGRGVVRVKFEADVIEDVVSGETIDYQVVNWDDYREGPAKRWSDVPWVAYRHEVSDEERKRLEDEDIVALHDESLATDEPEKLDAVIWEIWCKESGKIYLLSETSGEIISANDDVLGLAGFFPQGEPVQPITGTANRTPVCPYTVYQRLAEELDRTTKRINSIMKGLKVRGLFAGNAEDVMKLADADDNELIAATNLENLAATGGLDKAITWWPLETAIAVLRELYVQREATKQAIYELTGISDIVRGASAASETATAQQIKTEWGSPRIKRMQRMIERQVRDIFGITAEIISSKFTKETLAKITGIQIDKQVVKMLRSAPTEFRIDVETDSTVRADLTKSRSEMSEFLNGTANFFSVMAPVVAKAPTSAAPLAKMYGAFASQFSLGKSAEDALDQFIDLAEQAANQPQPNPEAESVQAELQMKGQELQMKMQEAAAKQQNDATALATEGQIKAAEMQQKAVEAEQKAAFDASKLQLDAQKLALDTEKLALEREKAAFDMGREEMETREGAMVGENIASVVQAVMGPALEQLAAGQQQLAAGQASLADALNAGNQQLVSAIMAEEDVQIVRDQNGRPVGAKKTRVLPERMN